MTDPNSARSPTAASIKGGTAPDRSAIPPVPRLSPDLIQRIGEVSRKSRADHPLPSGVAVQVVFNR
jgi:hypothetical protein